MNRTIQILAILVGLCLLLAGIPFAGVLAMIVLVLGIAQVPALIVTLPAIGYIWWRGDYGTVEAIIHRAKTGNCTAIVMGIRSAIARFFSGSVSDQVVRLAGVPVTRVK